MKEKEQQLFNEWRWSTTAIENNLCFERSKLDKWKCGLARIFAIRPEKEVIGKRGIRLPGGTPPRHQPPKTGIS